MRNLPIDKSLLKQQMGYTKKTHPFDMRPRFAESEYRQILQLAKECDLAENVALRAMVKLFLDETQKLSRNNVIEIIKTISKTA